MMRFGDVEVDESRREVRRTGVPVHLEPQAFDLLVLLISHRDRVVSHAELLDGVWGHRFLSDANVTTRVKEIRRAVGDDGSTQRVIRNVRGRGYRFVADVDTPLGPVAGQLVGRDHEVEHVARAVGESGLVTLIGPGGVGKSTLARAVADWIAPSHADGSRMVELVTLDDGSQVRPAVFRAVDIMFDHERPALQSLAERDVLLVLDNCEHVVDDVADLLDRVLTGSGRLRVLATSQVRLGLGVERIIEVRPLDPEQALDLFTTRVHSVDPAWAVDDVGTARVASLLARLDRLPLAIEMAAARLGSMTFDELESAMGDGLPTAMTHRSPVRRHRSPQSLVAWSADLLAPSLRETLTQFSVFAGPVSASDAVAVLATDHQVTVFDLAALSERSLLTVDVDGPASSYRMLDMVKSVAGQWLEESGSSAIVRRHHAEHFADVVRRNDREIRTPDEAIGRRRLDGVAAEVRAAHRWASRHDPALASDMSASLHLAAYSTFWNEPTEWARALLATDLDSDVLDGARLAVAGTAANVGDLAEAYDLGTRAARSRDPRIRATALEILADVAIYDGRLPEVAPLADELERLAEELGDTHFRTVAIVDASLALSFAGEARLGLERLGDFDPTVLAPSDHAWLMYTRGEALSALSDPAAAATFVQAVELASGIGNPFVTSVSRVSLAAELTRSGEFRAALDTYSQCLREYSRHGNYVHAVTALRNLIETLVAIGDDEGAAILAGATADDRLRPSYGPESERLGDVAAGVEARLGAQRAADRVSEGRELDVPAAVRRAIELVECHRA